MPFVAKIPGVPVKSFILRFKERFFLRISLGHLGLMGLMGLMGHFGQLRLKGPRGQSGHMPFVAKVPGVP